MLGFNALAVNAHRDESTSENRGSRGALTPACNASQNARGDAIARAARMINEHARFQLEAGKLGREHVFQVTVFEHEERRRKRYFAETQCSDPFHLVIQFIIRDAPDLDSLVARFVGQLEHRGFEARRMRLCSPQGKWEAWGPVPSAAVHPAAADPPPLETADMRRIAGVKSGGNA